MPQLNIFQFELPNGTPVAGGTFTARLSTDARTATNKQISAKRVVSFTLDDNGVVTTDLWPNDGLTPSNTFYYCKVITAQGLIIWEQEVTIATVAPPPVPTFSPVAGTYTSSQSVTLTSAGADAIYYTTDGSTPTTSSTLYTGAITVGVSETIKAIAILTVGSATAVSDVGSAAYVLQQATPTFSPVAGSYVDTQSVTITSAGADAIYYTTDGSTPTTGSTLYTGAISVVLSETVKAIAVKTGWADSAVGSAAYAIQQATPTFSPVAGSYSGAQNVTITSSGADAIYYTTDGSTPTTGSTLYTGAVTIFTTGTLKALAVKSGRTDSAVGSAAYVLPVVFVSSEYDSTSGVSNPLVVQIFTDSRDANFIIAQVDALTINSVVSTVVTDNLGNTWHPLALNQWHPSGRTQFFYAYNAVVGASHTVTATVTFAASHFNNQVALTVSTFAGIKSSSDPFVSGTDKIATGYPVAGTSIHPGSVTPDSTGDLVFTCVASDVGSLMSIDSGFVLVPLGPPSPIQAYFIAPNTSAVNPTWTYASTQNYPAANIAIFKHA